MEKRREENGMFEVVILSPVEVTLKECNGDETKMIKKFIKKVRKLEILKPYYDRLMFYETKSQKKRRKQKNARSNNFYKKDDEL